MMDLGFLMRGEILWNKASSSSPSTAWGSWCSAKNPTLRDIHEYILVFSKGMFSRGNLRRESTISKEGFLEFTKSVWTFAAEQAAKVGHPAPFPFELPYRLIYGLLLCENIKIGFFIFFDRKDFLNYYK